MPKVLRPIGHDDRLSVVDHLDELRSRLIVSGIALAVAFVVCFWQNQRLLTWLNHALPKTPKTSANHLNGSTQDLVSLHQGLSNAVKGVAGLAASHTFSTADQANLSVLQKGLEEAVKALPNTNPQKLPITIGIGEPFTTTIMVAAYFALIIALPVLIYELYAFVIPALHPNEKSIARWLVFFAPLLFIAGVVFTYFLVLPPAVAFLQGYNSQNFDILVQAKTYYKFEMFTMLGIGLAFQVPLLLLALQHAGVINASTLTGNWRYATVIIAVVVAALPGVDPVTMAFEMLPLVLLYLASIVMMKIVDRRAATRTARELARAGDSLDTT